MLNKDLLSDGAGGDRKEGSRGGAVGRKVIKRAPAIVNSCQLAHGNLVMATTLVVAVFGSGQSWYHPPCVGFCLLICKMAPCLNEVIPHVSPCLSLTWLHI